MYKYNFILAYNNETPPTGEAGSEEAPNTETTPPASSNPKPNTGNKTFTQDELNRFLAEERRKQETKNSTVIKQLETFKKSAELTAQQKEQLEKQIEELRNASLTKEEQLKREKEKAEKAYAEEKQRLESDAKSWQQRYANETVKRSIMDAAVLNDAYNPEQLVNILRSDTRLAELTDEDGKPTGEFIAKTRYIDKDKEGKPVTLELPVPDAIKRMKDFPERFGNLFKSGMAGGLGSTTKPGSAGGRVRVEDMSPQQYREMRKKNPNLLGLE